MSWVVIFILRLESFTGVLTILSGNRERDAFFGCLLAVGPQLFMTEQGTTAAGNCAADFVSVGLLVTNT